MNKLTLAGVATAVMLVLPVAASAASIDNVKFDNNQTTTQCTAGSSVNVTFRVTIPANEVIELAQVDVLNDNLAPALPTSVGGDLGLEEGQNDIQMSVICPQNTGNYDVQLKTAGIYGGQSAVNITDGVTATRTFVGALRVATNGSTSTGGSGTSQLDAILASIQALIASLAHPPVPPAPTTSAACTAYAQANAGTQMNTYNSANVRLQGFLLSQGASIPALAAGASFGFFGPQTQAAVSWFQNSNHCV